MKRSRNVFTPEFKQECVKLVLEQGYDVAQAASAMSVGKSSLQKWISQYRQERQGITPKASAITPEQLRIQSLEAENRQLNERPRKTLGYKTPSEVISNTVALTP